MREGPCLAATVVMTDHTGLSEAGQLSEDALRNAGWRLGAGTELREQTCRRGHGRVHPAGAHGLVRRHRGLKFDAQAPMNG